MNDKKKERISLFRRYIKKGNNIPFYISTFFDQNIEKIKEGKDIKFEHWKEFVRIFPYAKEIVGKPNKRTFNYYRNLWFLSKFDRTYRNFYEKELFQGKTPYFQINIDDKRVTSFPQVPRTIICSYIYSIILENELSIESIVQKVIDFILKDEYKTIKDFQNFLDNYCSKRSSRERKKINFKELEELREYLENPKYEDSFRNYFGILAKLVKKIKKLYERPEEQRRGISPSRLANDLNLSFSKTELLEIITYLKNRYNLSFFYSKRELEWLKENGVKVRKVLNSKSRWYWINQELNFKNKINKEWRSGLELAFEFFKLFVASKIQKENIKPTASNFRSTKYRYLYEKLKNIKRHNELLQYSDLSPIHEYLYSNMDYSELTEFFQKKVYPFLRKTQNIPDGIAPLAESVMKYYRGFINQIYQIPNLTYIDFIHSLNLKPQQDIRVEAGNLLHEIIRYIVSENNPYFYSEIALYEPLRNYTVDGLILSNKNFKDKIRSNLPELYGEIGKKKYFLFDYTVVFDNNGKLIESRVFERIRKYLRNPLEEALFIVCTRESKSLKFYKLPKKVKYKGKSLETRGVYLLNPFLFANIIGIKGDLKKIYKKAIVYHRNLDISKLLEIRKDLIKKNIPILTTKDLKKELRNENLIEIFDIWYVLTKQENMNIRKNLQKIE
ncbi:MAG: hypothetical protein BAJALOKI3v1_560013 [Promethearchaeota archaeon]|nr:MAG: hypothetical protein BAJALOKI3v1_560013 [Candidatus Lokiarchaeota archaeon]